MPTEIYISNLSEDVWSFIQAMPTKKRQYEIDENSYLSDRDILTLSPQNRSVFISPHPLDPDFLEYYQSLFNNQLVEVWVPNQHTGEICRDVLQDQLLWKRMVELAKKDSLVFKSYSASAAYFDLIDALRQEGAQITTPESPSLDSMWTVNYFGSKSGFRQLATELQIDDSAWLADGYISHGINDIASLASSYYLKHDGVVLKTNKGHAGMGVEIVHPKQLPSDFPTCLAHFKKVLDQEKYWAAFPVVVEAYMEMEMSIGGGNPNCEFVITPSGSVELLYICGMRVTPAGVFKGIEIGPNILPQEVVDRLLMYGQKLGEIYAQAGYQGYFDVDCVYTQDKQLLMTESNVRRTGGTHVFHAAQQLVGAGFMDSTFILSNNTYALPAGRFKTFKQIHDRLQPILFTTDQPQGVVIAAANPLKQDKFSYIIIGENQAQALACEQKMEELLQS